MKNLAGRLMDAVVTTEPHLGIAQRFWGRVRMRALLPYTVMGVLLIVVIVILGPELEHHIGAIEVWIEGLGVWGVTVFIGMFVVLSSMLLPDTVLAIIAGALFGLIGGTVAVVAGALIAASLQYVLSGHVLRKRIARILSGKPSFLAIQRAVLRQQFRLQVLLRLTPLNPAVVSYVLGATGVPFRGFIVACLALVPNLFIEVYFGHAGKHMAGMVGGDSRTDLMHDAVIIGGLLICVLVMVFVSRMARNAVQEAAG